MQSDVDSSIWTVHYGKIWIAPKASNNFSLFWKSKMNLYENDRLLSDLAHRYCRKTKWYLNFTQISSFWWEYYKLIFSLTHSLSHWDRINTIGFRIVCRFRICNLYSYTSSLSKSDSLTATLLCSATLWFGGFLRHISLLIQLSN